MSSVVQVCGVGRKGNKGDKRDWVRGLKMGQLTLSMGPARPEVCSYLQRATIPNKRVIPYIKYSFNTTYAIIFYEPCCVFKKNTFSHPLN
jgi:hypothetical protein